MDQAERRLAHRRNVTATAANDLARLFASVVAKHNLTEGEKLTVLVDRMAFATLAPNALLDPLRSHAYGLLRAEREATPPSFDEPMLCVDPFAGVHVGRAIDDGLALAKARGVTVVVLFNGHPVRCAPNATAAEVCATLPAHLK